MPEVRMNRRRIAVVGLILAMAGGAAWSLWTRSKPLEKTPLAVPAADDPAPKLSPPVEARRVPVSSDAATGGGARVSGNAGDAGMRGKDGSGRDSLKLFGQVISSVDRAPLRDAIIGVPKRFKTGRDDDESALMLDDVIEVTRSDVRGEFGLDEDAPGSVLVAAAPGFGPIIFDRNWLGWTKETALVIPVAAAASLKARVIDRTSGVKPDIDIRLTTNAFRAVQPSGQHHDGILMLMVGAHRRTDQLGEATFAALPAGVPFDVELWSEHSRLVRDPKPLTLDSGTTTEKEWRFGSGCTIRGRVIDQSNEPIADQCLWLTQRGLSLHSEIARAYFYSGDEEEVSKTTTTDREGRFTIADVEAGQWWLGPAPVGKRIVAPVADLIVIETDQASLDVTLRLQRGLFIRGSTVDPDGNPVRAHIRGQPRSEGLVGLVESDSFGSGGFSLGPLEPGDYEIEADSSPGNGSGRRLSSSLPTIVKSGSEGIVLQIRAAGSISLTIVRADNGEEVEAKLHLGGRTNRRKVYFWFPSLMKGSPHFNDLEPDTYDIAATTQEGLAGCLRGIVVLPDQSITDLRLLVEPAARLTFVYDQEKPEAAGVSVQSGSIMYGSESVRRGKRTTLVAPVGRVTATWNVGGEEVDEEVNLAVGETRELVWPRRK